MDLYGVVSDRVGLCGLVLLCFYRVNVCVWCVVGDVGYGDLWMFGGVV